MVQNRVISGSATTVPDNQKERFIGVIPDVYRGKGLGGKEQFNVIVTSQRIIFALIKASPSGIPSTKSYAGKTAEEILAENKKNFSVERGQLKSFTFTPGHSYIDCCRKLQEIDGQLEITTPKAKYSFYVPFRRNNIAVDVLSNAGLFSAELVKTRNDAQNPS